MIDNLELSIRVGVFALAFVALVAAERFFPLRRPPSARLRADRDNLLLFVVGVVCVRGLLPLGAVGAAFFAQRHAWGLLPALHVRLGVAFVLTVMVLDAAVYLQHRAMHRFEFLWRLHRVHHSDRFLDATSALRFHPLEILLSLIYKSALAAVLGAPPAAVLCFEVALNACALFNHSNLALSSRVERVLRWVLVTPAMHWIHHSVLPAESRRNFGFCFSGWDRLFATYQHAPHTNYTELQLGIEYLDDDAPGLSSLLLQPTRQVPAPASGGYIES